MIKSIKDRFPKIFVGSIIARELSGNVKVRSGMSRTGNRCITICIAGFLLGFFVLFISQPIYSQSKKDQRRGDSGKISKGTSRVIYVDPFTESVKETVDRIKKYKRLTKLMATPRNKKSTRDLITEKKLRIKVMLGIPKKKTFSAKSVHRKKKKKSIKASVSAENKKDKPIALTSINKEPRRTVSVIKKKSGIAGNASSKLQSLSSPSQKNKKIAQNKRTTRKGIKKSGSIGFNHLATGFPLTGAHFQVRCDRCHVGAVFRGTPRRCFSCHVRGGMVGSTSKSSNHIRTDNLCDNCHTTQNWASVLRVDHNSITGTCSSCHNGFIAMGKNSSHMASSNNCESCHNTQRWSAARFDHSTITGTCFSCHNGTTATGKSATHIQSANTCDDCHVTTNWTTVNFDHAGVTGTCFSCHNGTTATGKSATHLQTSNTCDDCHVTTNWTTVNFDHTGVTGTCSSCHNGTTATGKSATHIQTLGQCDSCHNTLAWSPANFDHSLVTGSCSSCHNGTTATGKPATHFVTSLQCDECHNTTNWLTINFSHNSASYPGDHNSSVTCIQCHQSNSQTVIWTSATYKPDCAGCHANNYVRDKHDKYPPNATYSVSELRDCSGPCHEYTDSTMTTIDKTNNNQHNVRDGAFQ